MKTFDEALKDNFEHITEISDIELIKKYRSEGIRIDDEGYYVKSHGDTKEFELRIEPFGGEGEYLIALYKNGILLIDKLHICKKK